MSFSIFRRERRAAGVLDRHGAPGAVDRAPVEDSGAEGAGPAPGGAAGGQGPAQEEDAGHAEKTGRKGTGIRANKCKTYVC